MDDILEQSTKGRKPKGERKRGKKVTAAFTEKEYKELLQKSEVSKVSVSQLVHDLAVKGKVVQPESKESRDKKIEAIREINNINQIAKNLNYLSKNFQLSLAEKLLKETNEILSKLYKILD